MRCMNPKTVQKACTCWNVLFIQFQGHTPVRFQERSAMLRSAGIVLTDQRICRSICGLSEICHLLRYFTSLKLVLPRALRRPPVCTRLWTDGRCAFPRQTDLCLSDGAVVTVHLLLYHVCNRFARHSGRFSPNFCISAQFFVWKSVAFLRISEETEQDSPIQIVTFSEILSYFRLTKQKKSGGCRTGGTIFLGNLSYCR